MTETWPIVRATLFFFFISILVIFNIYLLPGSLIGAYLLYVVMIGAAILYKRPNKLEMGTGLLWGLGLGALLITPIFLVDVSMGWLQIEGLVPFFGVILLLTVILEVLVAAGEESAFRGAILPDLLGLGTLGAVVVSSIMFSALHIPSVLFFDIGPTRIAIMLTTIFLAGVLMALLYLRWGLVSAMGFHFSWNTLQYHIFTLQQGVGIFETTHTGPIILTGGEVGPEAGLLGTLMIALGILLILFVSKKNTE